MNNIESEIIEYFENVSIVRNRHGVEMCRHSDDSFSAACKVPGFSYPIKEYSISLCATFDTVSKLIETFLITKDSDLENVTPDMLYTLYEKGEAAIDCAMKDYQFFGLLFRKVGSSLFATDDIDERTHGVIPCLQTQEQFYNYTVHFYETIYKKQVD